MVCFFGHCDKRLFLSNLFLFHQLFFLYFGIKGQNSIIRRALQTLCDGKRWICDVISGVVVLELVLKGGQDFMN